MVKDKEKKMEMVPAEAEALVLLRQLVQKEQIENCLTCPLDDGFLLRFLRSKKGDHTAAFQGIQSYYKMRDSIPDLDKTLNPAALQRAIVESNSFYILRNRDAQGRQIFLFKTGNWNPDEIPLEEIFLCCYLLGEELISYEETQKNGLIIIVDHANLSLTRIRKIAGQISLKLMKKIINMFQGTFPARFKDAHIVNHPFIFDMLFKMGKPFMSEKLKKRVHEHGNNLENLKAFMSPDILPHCLKGNVPDEECFDTEFMDRLMSKNDYYLEMAKYGYNKTTS